MKSSRSALMSSFATMAVLSSVSGCGVSGIIGKWAISVKTPGEKAAAIVITFKADGTASQTTRVMGHTVEGDYTYVLTADQITETLTAGTLDGKPIKVGVSNRPTVVYTYKLVGDTLTLKTKRRNADLTLKRQ